MLRWLKVAALVATVSVQLVSARPSLAAPAAIPYDDCYTGMTSTSWSGFERALVECERIWGPSDPRVAVILTDLSFLDLQAGRVGEAEATALRAQEILEQAGAGYEPQLCTVLVQLGQVYTLQGRNEEAGETWIRVVELAGAMEQADALTTAEALHVVGSDYSGAGYDDIARHLLLRALEIRETLLGPDDILVAQTLNSLGMVETGLARYLLAEQRLLRALAIRERTQGLEHEDVAEVLDNLGLLYSLMQRHEDAELALRRGLAIWEQTVGSEVEEYATTALNLSHTLNSRGLHREALRLADTGCEIAKRLTTKPSRLKAVCLAELGRSYLEINDYARAEFTLGLAVVQAEVVWDQDHPAVARALALRAMSNRYLEQFEVAERLILRAIAINERRLGPHHPILASNFEQYSTLLEAAGRPREAEQAAQRAGEIRERHARSQSG